MKKVLNLAVQINKRKWWHSPPSDKKAYSKRGVFLASSYAECEFYGRPLDEPINVNVANPLINTEENIIRFLFGNSSPQMFSYTALINGFAKEPLKTRFKLDKDLFNTAKNKDYDSIAIISEKGLEKVRKGKLPRTVELNVLDIADGILK